MFRVSIELFDKRGRKSKIKIEQEKGKVKVEGLTNGVRTAPLVNFSIN